MEEYNRSFKGIWIPKEIWLDERLTALDKFILVEIDSLDNDEGCTASNEYLAEFCDCAVSKVSRSISKLKKYELIKDISFNGRTRKLQSCLAKKARQTSKKSKADYQKKQGSPYNNNIDNNIDIIIRDKPKRFIPPTLEEVKEYCIERKNNVDAQRFIDYYSSNGWKVGRNSMKDWKAAIRTWEKNQYSAKPKEETKKTSYDLDEWEKIAKGMF